MSAHFKLHSSLARLPERATNGSAGYDLYASEDKVIPARTRALVDTGLSMCIPSSCYGRIAPRSGLAAKFSIDVGAGVIDSDYRGLVKVLLINHGEMDYSVKVGDRIAQLIFEKIEHLIFVEAEELPVSEQRGEGGFGSTGF